ncbi:hypothetical protein cypCar_00041205 [Cyprinus carpio]|nr:hypothetical protein cypCar_00041205 [Cyprinus carpio]
MMAHDGSGTAVRRIYYGPVMSRFRRRGDQAICSRSLLLPFDWFAWPQQSFHHRGSLPTQRRAVVDMTGHPWRVCDVEWPVGHVGAGLGPPVSSRTEKV